MKYLKKLITKHLTPRHPSKNMLNLQKSKENNGTYRRVKKSIWKIL